MRVWPFLLLLGACHARVEGDPEPVPRPSAMPSAASAARLPGAAPPLAPLAPEAPSQEADAGRVNRTLIEALDRLQRCHARSAHSWRAGKVDLTLAVEPNGKVRSIATTTTFPTREVADCVEREVRSLPFPSLEGPVTVVVPLEFVAGRPPSHL